MKGRNKYIEGRTGFDGRIKQGKRRLAELREKWAAIVPNIGEERPDTEWLDLDDDLSLDEENDSTQSEDDEEEEVVRMIETRDEMVLLWM